MIDVAGGIRRFVVITGSVIGVPFAIIVTVSSRMFSRSSPRPDVDPIPE